MPNFSNHTKSYAMTEWYDFSNVKSSKMLSFDPVAEAYGLIYPRFSGENFSFVHTLPDDGRSISRNVAEKHHDSRHDKVRKQYFIYR